MLCDTLLELELTDIFELRDPHDIEPKFSLDQLDTDKKLHYHKEFGLDKVTKFKRFSIAYFEDWGDLLNLPASVNHIFVLSPIG